MTIEAMKQALEAMEYADACLKKQLTTKTKHEYAQDLLMDAGVALRQAIEQAEKQEPVAYKITGKLGDICSFNGGTDVKKGDLVYTTPQPQDAEIKRLKEKIEFLARTNMLYSDWEHRETQVTSDLIRKGIEAAKENVELQAEIERLKKREWVGLTDEEMLECNMDGDFMINRETSKRNVEAKLKEKNQ
jgi:hypothetical protein